MVGSSIPVIWVLGGPGAGKGTQCEKIVANYGFSHLSTGDLLRAEVASGSDKGKELDGIMKRGELVSNEAVLDLLEQAMRKVESTAKGFLIDGYPREKNQGAAFEKAISPVDIILYFKCKPETMVERILRRAEESEVKRADDNEATIRTRIQTFIKNTDEILVQYPSQTRRINGERAVDEIFADVVTAINDLLASKTKVAAAN